MEVMSRENTNTIIYKKLEKQERMKILKVLIIYLVYTLNSTAQTFKIDVNNAIFKEISMSEIMDDVKVIDIKIPADVKIEDFRNVYLTNDGKYLVIAHLGRPPYMFDIAGKFVKEMQEVVLNYGSKAVMYESNWFTYQFDMKRNIFYQDFLDKWIGIDIFTNKMVKQILKPKQFSMQIANFIQLSEDEYLGYVNNTSGNCSTLFAIFDSSGQVLQRKVKNRAYTKVNVDNPYFEGLYYEYNSNCFCLEPFYGTTVYKVEDRQFYPYIYFNAGDKSPIYEYQDLNRQTESANRDEWKIGSVYETEGNIYFSYTTKGGAFWGYYCKQKAQVYIATNSQAVSLKKEKLGKDYFFPSFRHGEYSITSEQEGDVLKVTIGKLK